MSKRFVTLFPICENVHLTKDLGQIPYFLHKKYGYDSSIVCYQNNEHYPNLETEVKGLKLEFIENRGRWSFLERSVITYLRENAKKIDILNLYIFSKHTFAYALLYKRWNPEGKVFLKLDGYNETFSGSRGIRHSVNPAKNLVFKFLEKEFLKKVNLISIENTDGEDLVRKKFSAQKEKIFYLPVGVNDLYLENHFNGKLKGYKEKENIILTVGRIGEPIKNNEMMLKALARIDMKEWRMVFVGPVNPGFENYCDEFMDKHPGLRGKIEFTGEIKERSQLYEWYNRSKIFCMTSRRESFCHSIAEALYFGNYIVGTEGVMSMRDISKNGDYGMIVGEDDEKDLGACLQGLIDQPEKLGELYPRIIEHSRKNFTWSGIIDKVHERIERS